MPQATVVIDGNCGFCQLWSRRIDLLIRRFGGRAARIVPSQQLDLATLGVPAEQTERELVFVAPDRDRATRDRPRRRTSGGADAVADWLIWAGGPPAVIGRLQRIPGVRQLSQLAYGWIAANRYRLPGSTDQCALPDAADMDQAQLLPQVDLLTVPGSTPGSRPASD